MGGQIVWNVSCYKEDRTGEKQVASFTEFPSADTLIKVFPNLFSGSYPAEFTACYLIPCKIAMDKVSGDTAFCSFRVKTFISHGLLVTYEHYIVSVFKNPLINNAEDHVPTHPEVRNRQAPAGHDSVPPVPDRSVVPECQPVDA